MRLRQLLVGAALPFAILAMGCESPCDKTSIAIQDVAKATRHLSIGIENPELWPAACDTLVRYVSLFHGNADYLRGVASDYTNDYSRCIGWDEVQVCRGGWVRRRYPAPAPLHSSLKFLEEFELVSAAMAEESPEEFGNEDVDAMVTKPDGRTPGRARPAPRPAPRPHPTARPAPRPVPQPRPPVRPVPRPRPNPIRHRPPHYPSHPRWHWVYEPRICSWVRTCVAWERGYSRNPTADQANALAYEFDQAAGAIEMMCDRVYAGADAAEVTPMATEALQRVNTRLSPDTQLMYRTLGCSK